MIQTQTYVRKPLYVEAVQVSAENFNEIALWCQGDIQEITEKGRTFQFISVRVTNPMNPRQGQARVGDWILTSERGYKVYTPRAFEKAFDTLQAKMPGEGVTLYQNGYTAEELQQMFGDKSLEGTALNTGAVGSGPMPEQAEPTDVEEPAKVPAVPENLEERDPNTVYPDTPETTA